MKEVYVLRHGEKNAEGLLTEQGIQAAEAKRPTLPAFVRVISSGSDRTIHTARLLTGEQSTVDQRAAYATAGADVSAEIAALAVKNGSSWLDAARLHNDPEILKGIDEQAQQLNELIDEVLEGLTDGEQALIVSHDLTIAPAMGLRGMSAESIEPLGGYVVSVHENVPSVRRH